MTSPRVAQMSRFACKRASLLSSAYNLHLCSPAPKTITHRAESPKKSPFRFSKQPFGQKQKRELSDILPDR